jgi:flagellar biosynthetic protein FlhB
MSEDGGTDDSQKTEEPTARKLEEARKRGQVIYSREVTNWVLMFVATLLVVGAGPPIASSLMDILRVFLERPHDLLADPAGLGNVLRALLAEVALLVLLPMCLLIVAAVFSGYIQTGPIFTAETIKPDLKKISVISGFGRLFSKRALAEFLKSLAKLVVIGVAATLALMPYFAGLDHFVGEDIAQSMFDMQTLFIKMMTAILIILFLIALGDYLYQRHEFMEKMKMSKQEIKDEYKQTEGDPHVKGKLRQLREQKARQRMIQNVPDADVIITNPTHYAVALKYDPKEMDAPKMVAKGTDAVAEKIKEVGRDNKVPVIENPILCRALFDSMDIDQFIPTEHFKAVAEVITYVFKLKGKRL